MRTKRRVLLVVVVVAAAIFLAWLALRPRVREPGYGGEKLNYWLRQYANTQPGSVSAEEHDQAALAVREIGTNAIPALLRMLQEKDSRITLKVYELLSRQRLIPNPIIPAEARNYWAMFGFEILGPEAKSAVPAMIEILEHNDSEYIRSQTAWALGGIGPEARQAVPALLRSVTTTNRPANGPAVVALGQIHSDPDVVLPVLLKCMTNSDRFIYTAGIRAIGDFGPDAQQAIPALIAEATNSTSRLRTEALRVLGRIHAQPELIVPVLTPYLTNSNAGLRSAAAEGLGSFGGGAKSALSNLLELITDNNSFVRAASLDAASQIDIQNEDVVRALSLALSDTNFLVQYTAATNLVAASAKSLLDTEDARHSATPGLVKALQNERPEIRVAAQAVLKRIDPEGAAKAGVK